MGKPTRCYPETNATIETMVAEMQAARASDVLHATPITQMHTLPKGSTIPVGRIGEMVKATLAGRR